MASGVRASTTEAILNGTADEILEQHSRYALIVTRGVRDASGNRVEASPGFVRFRHDLNFGHAKDGPLKTYRKSLLRGLARASAKGIHPQDVAVASVFTTQSVSAILEKIRDQIKAAIPEPADFHVAPAWAETVFRVADIRGITVRYHVGGGVGDVPPRFNDFTPRLPLLGVIRNSDGTPVVGTFAVGKYTAPVYAQGGVIRSVGTRSGTPEMYGEEEVFFTVFLPSGARPPGGWPVVVFGPGQPDDDLWGTPFNIAATMAAHGLATVSIQSAWQGFGPLSTATVRLTTGAEVSFPAGGRNSDKDGDGDIEAVEGITLPGAQAILGSRDAWRQTIADTMQFVHVIEGGIDVDGDRLVDLDPSRIYYLGFSGGTWRGVALVAVESAVRAAVLNGGGAGEGRLAPAGNRTFLGTLLAGHVPSLINPAGAPLVTGVGGIPVSPPFFNENLPLRDEPPTVNTVTGAIDIQRWLDRRAWLNASADPIAFAPYLRKSPLQGLPARPVIVSFVRGDQTIPNPAATALLRAGDLADRATFFRNDLAFACDQTLEKNSHAFLTRMNAPRRTTIALAAQKQVATFFASDGTVIIDPDDDLFASVATACKGRLFEVPIILPLPEDLGFIP